MFRSKRRISLLVLVLAMLALVAVPSALAAQSHLRAQCDGVDYAFDTSETGDVSHSPIFPGDGTAGSASAQDLSLQAQAHSLSDDGEHHQCDILTTFSNTVRIEPGSSGLSSGDPVTLAVTVNLDGVLSAVVPGPPAPGPAASYDAGAIADADLHITAPDRIVCQVDDGREVCNPAEVGHFSAGGDRDLIGYPAGDPSQSTLGVHYIWDWFVTNNRGDIPEDHDSVFQDCNWASGCVSEDPPPPPAPDFRGTHTFLVDAFVGDRLQLDGLLNLTAGGDNGWAEADFQSPGYGFVASLAAASGFEGLRLTYEQAPPAADLPPTCAPVSTKTDEDTPLQGTLACDDESPSTLAYTLRTGPVHGQVVLNNNGSYTYTPAANFNGLDSFQVQATDGSGQVSQPATVTVTVDPVNDRPVCSAKAAFATVGQTAQLDAECDDADRDPLTIAITAQGTKGTATVKGLEIDYKPTQAGTDSFTYTASDGTLTSQPATITVTNQPAPPSLTMTITQGLVVFTKPPDDDRARFTGTFATNQQLTCNKDVTVSLNTSVFTQTVPGSAFQSQNKGQLCVYTRLTAGGTGGIKRLELNLASKTFLVKLRDEVELSPLTNPVTLGLKIGGLSTSQTVQMKQARNRWTYPS